MSIVIHKPELERRVQERMQSGRFQDAEELLSKALDALSESSGDRQEPPIGRSALLWKAYLAKSAVHGYSAIRGCRSRPCSKILRTA